MAGIKFANFVVVDVAIVTSLNNVPADYSAVSQTSDSFADADLWRDGYFSRKRRFLAYKLLPIADCTSDTPVLIRAILLNDHDGIPSGYRPITQTIDTQEKPLKRKIFCSLYAPFSSARIAVTGLSVFADPRSSHGLETIGETNSLTLLFKILPIKEDSTQTRTNTTGDPRSSREDANKLPESNDRSVSDGARLSKQWVSPLQGVPIVINHKYTAGRNQGFETFDPCSVRVKTLEDIEKEYSYSFVLEHSLVDMN